MEGRRPGGRFSPDGTRIAACLRQREVTIFDVATGRVLRVFRGHRAEAGAATWTPDGSRLITLDISSTMHVWDLRHGEEIAAIPMMSDGGEMSWTPEGDLRFENFDEWIVWPSR